MEDQQKEFYQLLQFLAFYLSGGFSKEELVKHEEIAELITNFLNLDLNDPEVLSKIKTYFAGIFPELNPNSEDFYSQVYWKIEKILSEKGPLPSAALPPNLKQLVKEYELFLQQAQQKTSRLLFVQEEPPPSYQELIKEIKLFLKEILNSKNETLIEHLAQEIAQEIILQTPPTRDPSSFQASFPPEEYQELLKKSLSVIPPSLQPKPPQLIKLSEKTYGIITQVSCSPHKTLPPAAAEEKNPNSPFLYQHIFSSLAEIAGPEETEAIKKAAEETTKQILLKITQGEITPQKAQEIAKIIKDSAERAGLSLPPPKIKNLTSQIIPEIPLLATLIEDDISRWQEVIQSQIQNLTGNPLKVAREIAQKTVFMIITSPQASPEELEKKLASFFPEEIKISLEEKLALAKKAINQVASWSNKEILEKIYSLSPKLKPSLKKTIFSPLVKPLEFLVNLAPEEFRQKHPGLVYAAKGFTPNNVEALVSRVKNLWPQSLQLKFWQKIRLSFADKEFSSLINLFNRFYSPLNFKKLAFRIFHHPESRLIKFLTFGKIKTFPDLKRIFWARFRDSKIGAFFARAASGFLKKTTQWLGVKVGGRLGLSAIASFFATPLGGIATFLLTSIPSFFKKIFKAGSGKKRVSSFASKTSSRLVFESTGFLTRVFYAFSSVSLSSLSGIGVAGAVIILTVFVFLIVLITGGAVLEEGRGTTPGYIGKQVSPRSPEEAAHLAEKVIWTLNQCGITEVNSSFWEETRDCLLSSSLPNPEAIIGQFSYSVFNVGPGLQCVGFVRGVMAALGKDPGGGRDAYQYLDPPAPPGYVLNNDPKKVEIGDLAIMKAGEFGHIGIVVNKEGDYIWLAQAFGDQNGKISITKIKPIYFDGFLKPQ